MLPTPGATPETTSETTLPILLGNYIKSSTKFKICGTQNGKAISVEITVKPYTAEWSAGWDTGDDKIVTIKSPYSTKSFCPFKDEPGNIAIFRP